MPETNQTNQVVITFYGNAVGAYAAAMSQALSSAGAPGWLQGKFVVIGATGDALKVAVAADGGDPAAIGQAAMEAIGAILGGTLGGIAGSPFGPVGAAAGSWAGSELGSSWGRQVWNELTSGEPQQFPQTWEIEGLPTMEAVTEFVPADPAEWERQFGSENTMDLEGWNDYFKNSEDIGPWWGSPIVLDLDGDGVETVSVDDGVYFDHNDDGFIERTGWVGADDGLLAYDRDGDGRISSGRELFGSNTLLGDGSNAGNGFEALSEFDGNADGAIDALDAIWANLRVWRDLNGNGVSEAEELLLLGNCDVSSISLGYASTGVDNGLGGTDWQTDSQGNQHRQIGSFTRTNGTTGIATDVWFDRNPTRTIVEDWVDVPENILALPDARGSGTVRDLRQAMTLDATGALQQLVTAFTLEQDRNTRSVLLQQILFRWAGVENIDPASRGIWMDARRLSAMEEFYGRDFVSTNYDPITGDLVSSSDVNGRNNAVLDEGFILLSERVYAELMAQTHLQQLFDAIEYVWNAEENRLDANLIPVADQLLAYMSTDPVSGRQELSEFVRCLRGFGIDQSQSFQLFGDYLVAQDAALADVIENSIGINVFVGTDSDDDRYMSYSLHVTDWESYMRTAGLGAFGLSREMVVSGGNGNDLINGGERNDILTGGEGNDSIIGWAGDDLIIGGAGNDYLQGGEGNNVYAFASGFGQDQVYETNAEGYGPDVDTIRFEGGITIEDVEFGQEAYADLYVEVKDTADRITFWQWYGGYSGIERFEFADGTVFTAHDVTLLGLLGTSQNDHILGTTDDDTLGGKAGNDYLHGDVGNDVIDGGSGNDYLDGGIGADTLTGGEDNDTLEGGDGADTYLFARGFGQDTIYEYDQSSGGNDIVHFAADTLPAEVELSRNEYDLFLKLVGTDDRITVSSFFADDAYRIERVEFADGTVWDDAALASAKYLGTEGSDFITGTDTAERFETGAGDDHVSAIGGNDVVYGGTGSDTLSGDDGNDTLYGEEDNDTLNGGAGADTVYGGTGNDTLEGGDGADTYLFARGFGQDTIYEYDQGSGGNDTVCFAAGILPAEVGLSRNEFDLFLKVLGTEDRITVSSFFADDAYRIEHVEFADGTVWDQAALAQARYLGTEGADHLYGTDDAEHFEAGAGDDYVLALGGNDLVYGGAGNDSLIGDSGNDLLQGEDGDDSLDGGDGNDTLEGGNGNDYLNGGGGADTYWLARGYGNDTILEYDFAAGNTDVARLDAGIAVDQLWFRQEGNDLEVSIIGTTDRFTIQNWYLGTEYRIEQFRTADDRLLLDSQVENLIQAMAAFSPPAAGQTTLPQNYQDALNPVIAANWQ